MNHDRRSPDGGDPRYGPWEQRPSGYRGHGRDFSESDGDDDTRMLGPAAGGRHSGWSDVGREGWADSGRGDPQGAGQRWAEQSWAEHGGGSHAAPYGRSAQPYGDTGVPPRTTSYSPRYQPGYQAGYQPGYQTRRAEQPRQRASAGLIVGRIVTSLVAIALLAISGFAWATVGSTPHNASDATKQAGTVGVVPQTTTDAAGNVVKVAGTGMNILIVGSDARTDANGNPLSPAELKAVSTQLDGGGVSTDTIMIVHVPGNGEKATAISIPRDSWIPASVTQAPGVVGPYSDGTEGPYKPNKINSFYGTAKAYEQQYLVSKGVTDKAELERRSNEAGRTMLIKVLQQFTGIKIDHYAEVNLISFYLLSKAVGGVPVCLVKATKDRQSGADFPAGHFEVEGSSALSFVRQRHGLPGGDLDRIKRQQMFLASAANKILSVGTLTSPSKLSALIDAADRSVVLDSGFNLLSFAQQMIGLTSGKITFTTVPTHGDQPGVNTSALKVDPTEVRALFAKLMTDSAASSSSAAPAPPTSVAPSSVTVDVQNGTETSGMAAMVGAKVAAAGFQRGQLSDYPGVTPDNQQKQTTVHYPAGGEAAAAEVLKAIGVGKAVSDDSVAAGHVTVVVGTDMPVHPISSTGAGAPSSAPATVAPAATSGARSAAQSNDVISAADTGCIN